MSKMDSPISLQQAFKDFQKNRKKQIKVSKMNCGSQEKSTESKRQLRQLFLNQAKKYIGTPYNKKYLDPSSDYCSELFLDCCGLIRHVLQDLKEEFGFEIGPWNQAYQYDTLPNTIKKDDMLPGDLVFISGIYHNEKSKRHPHNMVHVEVWLGEGDKTIGARWKTSKVEVHDSYMFDAKSYHSMEYHFKSIDKWLSGICKSHCPEHTWSRIKYNDHSKYSIFASESDDEGVERRTNENDTIGCCDANIGSQSGDTSISSKLSTKTVDDVKKKETKEKKRTFYIGGKNGVQLVEKPLLALGMVRTFNDSNWFLKWVEIKKQINFRTFRPDMQLVNHIEGINCITTKTGFVRTLREYERMLRRQGHSVSLRSFSLSEFFMESYLLDEEKRIFQERFKAGELWIVKPAGRNQGKGIYLVNDLNQLDCSEDKSSEIKFGRNSKGIVQRYIMNPLLINGHKFDVRVYMLISSTRPYIAFYHKGYIRLSCVKYSTDTLDIHTHLTNQYVQKKHPLYSENKENTVLSFDQFNKYINENEKQQKGLVEDWVYKVFTPSMKNIMVVCLNACKHKIERTEGCFELLGFDFMIDEHMKTWLIEININPALHTNCNALKETIPPVVEETLCIMLEMFEKRKSQSKLNRLKAVKNFELLINADSGFIYKYAKTKE